MKKIIITSLLILLYIAGFSQNLSYEVHGKYSHPIIKEKLDKANFMGDIIPYYPSEWIVGYVSAEILATNDGKVKNAASASDTLTAEQKSILNSVDPGTEIVIHIKYKSRNSVTDNIEVGTMKYSVTVVPETEAEYTGGYQQLKQYLKENAISKIPDTISKQLQPVIVSFTVNERGGIADAKVFKTSGDQNIDQLLLEVINNMPRWKPAENSEGKKVKQEFELSVEAEGC